VGGGREREDRALFEEAMADVKPLVRPGTPGASRSRRPPRAQARFARAGQREVLEEALHAAAGAHRAAAERAFSRPGVSPATVKRLRRGQYPIQAELDLHGLSLAQARQALHEFLLEARARHLRCVRIIHGKGLRSGPDGPVLGPFVAGALARHDRVAAFVPARVRDGGTGAVYVLFAA
jgi:DNA-nicking Smr family endonuclease